MTFVRLEIEAALARNIRVVPILVSGARMPRADDLAPTLARLARRQALELEEVPPSFPFSWLPLAILIWVGEDPVGILTAAPYPLADIGVAPQEPIGSTGAEA